MLIIMIAYIITYHWGADGQCPKTHLSCMPDQIHGVCSSLAKIILKLKCTEYDQPLEHK